jgi:hypothetical protein
VHVLAAAVDERQALRHGVVEEDVPLADLWSWPSCGFLASPPVRNDHLLILTNVAC